MIEKLEGTFDCDKQFADAIEAQDIHVMKIMLKNGSEISFIEVEKALEIIYEKIDAYMKRKNLLGTIRLYNEIRRGILDCFEEEL